MKFLKIWLIVLLSIPFVLSSLSIRVKDDITQAESLEFLKYPKIVIATDSKFTEEIVMVEKEIDFITKFVDDAEMELGLEALVQDGKEGRKKVVTTIVYYDGDEYERNVEEEIIEDSIDKIIARGTKIVPKTLDTEYGGITYIRKFSDFWATSYDSTCPGCSSTTATGMKQGYGVVAVDPKVIPLYSKLYIPGYGIAIAGDVGGSVKGNKIDLGFDSLNGQWKAHYVDVYLLQD